MAYQGSLFEITVPNGDSYSSINLLNAQVTQVSVPSATNVQVTISVDKFYWLSASSFGFYKNSFFVASFEDKISASTLTEIVIPNIGSSSTNTVDFLLMPREGSGLNIPVYGLYATYKIHDGDTILFRANETDNAIIVCGVLPKYSQINYADIANTPTLATVATSGSYADLATKLSAGSNISFGGTDNLTISATDTKPDNWYVNDSFSDVLDLATGGTWKSIATFNIPYAGTWLLSVAVQYPSNSTGCRGAGIYAGTAANPTDVSGVRYQQTVRAADGAATNIVVTVPTTIASNNRTVHIMGRQTSGSAMGTTTNPIRVRASAIRLTPATS